MKIIALYVKTHRKTGLKYLGKTILDPYTYKGSGTYWNRHLNKHGNDVHTEVIRWCTTESIRYWGIYYSNLYNVVENPRWANLRPEIGDGGWDYVNAQGLNRVRMNERLHVDEEWTRNYRQAVSDGVNNYYASGGTGSFTGKAHTAETISKMHVTHTLNKHQQGVKNSQHGSMWINNNIANTKWPVSKGLPQGWHKGRNMQLPSLTKEEKLTLQEA
jgi:hypothetical protein